MGLTKKDFIKFAEMIKEMKTEAKKYEEFEDLEVISEMENRIIRILKGLNEKFNEEKFREATRTDK